MLRQRRNFSLPDQVRLSVQVMSPTASWLQKRGGLVSLGCTTSFVKFLPASSSLRGTRLKPDSAASAECAPDPGLVAERERFQRRVVAAEERVTGGRARCVVPDDEVADRVGFRVV